MTMAAFVALTSGLASLGLTGIVRAYAISRGILDRPNARSSHTNPTPRGGGIALILASLAGVAAAVAAKLTEPRDALTVVIGIVVLGTIGAIDDMRSVGAVTRLVTHVGVAAWTLYMFNGLPFLYVGSITVPLGAAGYVLGVLGIVWSINLFNFMDGIDGLAGSQSALILGAGGLLLLWRGETSFGTISLVVAASAAGFLVWNWPPAKIFMGDAGSGVIGFVVAAIAIGSENRRSVPLLAFAIISGLFVADATITLVRRVARGEHPADAHREHAYQRLTRMWGSHRSVSAASVAVTLLLALIAAVATTIPSLLLPSLFAALLLVGALLVTIELYAPM